MKSFLFMIQHYFSIPLSPVLSMYYDDIVIPCFLILTENFTQIKVSKKYKL